MIKNHRVAAGETHGTFAFVAGNAFAEAQVAGNDIMAAAKRNRAAINHHAIPRGRLPGQRNIAAHRQIGF